MKRYIGEISLFFKKMGTIGKVILIIGGIVGIIVAALMFTAFDTKTDKTTEYEVLEQQANAVCQNPMLLFEIGSNINAKEGIITVCFENERCQLTAQYNQDFEIISISKEDHSVSWLLALVLSLLAGIMVGYLIILLIILGVILTRPIVDF